MIQIPYIDENKGEIVISVPLIQSENKFFINVPCKITSNCHTIIKSPYFLSELTFQTTVNVQLLYYFSLKNCTFTNSNVQFPRYDNFVLTLLFCKYVKIQNVNFIDLIDNRAIYQLKT